MKKLLFSFRCAIKGIVTVIKEEQNFRIQLLITIFVLTLGILLKLSRMEFLFIVLSTAFVLACEIINTAIEDLCNKIEPHHDETIGKIKDIMAGLVLVSAIFSLVVASIIFLPKIF